MRKYTFSVSLCNGCACGNIIIESQNENDAYQNALDYVCDKLAFALPELDIEVSVHLESTKLTTEDFIKELKKAKQYCKGTLELDLNDWGEWKVLDYIEEFEAAMPIVHCDYDEPIITEDIANDNNIDVRKCCDIVGAYYVG